MGSHTGRRSPVAKGRRPDTDALRRNRQASDRRTLSIRFAEEPAVIIRPEAFGRFEVLIRPPANGQRDHELGTYPEARALGEELATLLNRRLVDRCPEAAE